MADPREINPFLKLSLDIGPIVLFFAAYIKLKDRMFTIGGTEYEGFIVVTACFIPLILASTAILWKLTGKLSQMQVITAILITVMGGLSVWFNDERFFKMKPTMIYLLFAAVLGFGLLRGQSYLKLVMEEMMPLEYEGWMILTRRLTGFFFGLALLNEVIWRNFSTEHWVYFKTFGLTAAVFIFFITQGGVMRRHGIEEDDGA
ncbi:intracellular septation protein A [Litorivita pollutaquae]|uniref:Inner membrane-spanning protein YciB n=1 Tax=Litorivita pollutaquae TaxID=2200892 RepID=A0A2V4N218_9RHOB|nr:inner membrane-spanning protein YciB [Litorivita pollutaquae]OUS20746.1 intracellular septation protein A [Rhodobacterales bacterium 59_46_T64]PYC48814.1 intracellular septation protein A [Litorivita pollutaquae]